MHDTQEETDDVRGQVHESRSRLVKGFLVCAGSLFVGLGIMGVVLPLLPTTPFLLLAAACYAHSSERFYVWLLTNRVFGQYLRDWRENRGIPLMTKIWIIAVMLCTMAVTAIFFVPLLPVQVILMAIAVGVSVYIWRQPTKNVGRYEEDAA